MNFEWQLICGYWLKLIDRKDYGGKKAKRFVFKHSNQNMWIPNGCLLSDGTIIKEKTEWLFKKETNQMRIAKKDYKEFEASQKELWLKGKKYD